jgi:endonuclease/exonuclease/phosphatase family metal-dependent hydrolase
MSYNTRYDYYTSQSNIDRFGSKISEVRPGIVGTQECQDKHALAAASGYTLVPDTGFQNPIFYDPDQVTFVPGSSGLMQIPDDHHAERTITWAKFELDSRNFWFFNTHLPHNGDEATSRNTHASIALDFLERRRELGAENSPTVVVGDTNPHASNGAEEGSFGDGLIAAGFELSYASNSPLRDYDKIFASPHWSSSNGADRGTGGSDHTSVAVDLELL